jgi:predicted phosphoribosyltransferase
MELASRLPYVRPIVLALPRGGVAVAAPVAEALRAPLDVIAVRKLGAPFFPELAMGAIAGDTCVLDQGLICRLHIGRPAIDAVIAKETRELRRREALYRRGLSELALEGRTVVLVDDGVATGSTMTAAAREARRRRPDKLILAAPVASSEAARHLAAEADECVWLAVPNPFFAVGDCYRNFRQTTDAEVQELLQTGRNSAQTA